MKVVSTEALTKLIQLVKSAFIKVDDVVEVSEIETETPNEITLATVATSGSYDDLSDKPTIPAATSDLTNDSGYITSSALTPYVLSADLASVATSGSYNDLLNKPDLSTKAEVDLSNINTNGKSFASGLAMPSSRYIDLTLGASGASYTAPANGWIFLRFDTGSGLSFITIVNNGLIADQSICEQAHTAINKLFIVPKGEYKLYYANITPVIFRFVYAGGEA